MPNGGLKRLADYFWRTAAFRETEGVSDGALLSRFADGGDREAFAALVGRHGPLVWSVCRRMLRFTQDCEEAFQASFLILARRAGSVRSRDSVRSWLYGVAVRVASRARSDAGRRLAAFCDNDPEQNGPGPVEQAHARELSEAIDEAVAALPERQRLAVLLTYFVGKTNDEAAGVLGCPRGTIATLLARARERLRRRLSRLGVVPALGGTAWFWLEGAAQAAPAQVSASTVGAAMATRLGLATGAATSSAAGLMESVMRSMFLAKLKVTAAVLTVVLAAGVGTGLWRESTAGGQVRENNTPATPANDVDQLRDQIRKAEALLDSARKRLIDLERANGFSNDPLAPGTRPLGVAPNPRTDPAAPPSDFRPDAVRDPFPKTPTASDPRVKPPVSDTRPAPGGLRSPFTATEDRLRKIEHLLDEMRKEVEAIRRESKTGAPPPPTGPVPRP
jgi:RNA polymerase sigma factor (sigma-70 family)